MHSALVKLHDRFAQPRPPLWARSYVWLGLAAMLFAASFALIPGNGRGQGVFFTYAIFADGRRVPGWVSKDTTGATAELYFAGNIWSTEVLGFREWRCDISTGDRLHGPVPPSGMTQADVDSLRRDGCDHLIEASHGDQWSQFILNGTGDVVPLREDIPALDLMAQGGGFTCGSGLKGRVGQAMHRLYRWSNRASLGCVVLAFAFGSIHHYLRKRIQGRIDLLGHSLCSRCEYPLLDGDLSRCTECGTDAGEELRRCQILLSGTASQAQPGPQAPLT